jgi:hypothetical protein
MRSPRRASFESVSGDNAEWEDWEMEACVASPQQASINSVSSITTDARFDTSSGSWKFLMRSTAACETAKLESGPDEWKLLRSSLYHPTMLTISSGKGTYSLHCSSCLSFFRLLQRLYALATHVSCEARDGVLAYCVLGFISMHGFNKNLQCIEGWIFCIWISRLENLTSCNVILKNFREWNLTSSFRELHIFFPNSHDTADPYTGRQISIACRVSRYQSMIRLLFKCHKCSKDLGWGWSSSELFQKDWNSKESKGWSSAQTESAISLADRRHNM